MKQHSATLNRFLLIPLLAAVISVAGAITCQSSYAGVLDSFSDNPIKIPTGYSMHTDGGTIYVEQILLERYLFLPNEADTGHIVMDPPKNDPNGKLYFVVNGRETDTLNLADLSAKQGKYSVTVRVRDKDGKRKSSFNLKIMRGSGIGTVYFTSEKSLYGRTWIDADKEHESSGKAIVYDANGKNLTKDEKSQVITDFHGRGNSSWHDPKKGYQLKFDKKISLVDGTGKEKKWVLLAQYKDPLHLSDKITKDIAAMGSNNFSPVETWVNFYYDGEYRGVYLLGEKNEIKESRVNIHDMEDDYESQDASYGDNVNVKEAVNDYGNSYRYQEGLTGPKRMGGFLIEMNEVTIDENNGFRFRVGSSERAANLKSPDLGSQEAVKYISEYFQEFCDAVHAKDDNGKYTGKNPTTGRFYYDYCDIDSLVDTYLSECVVSNWDTFYKSQYFYKDRGGKLIAAPMWDADLSIGTGWGSQSPTDADYMTSRLITGDLIHYPAFRAKLKERYQQVYAPIMDSLISSGELMPTFQQSFDQVRSSLAMDWVLWTNKYQTGNGDKRWSSNTSAEEIVEYRINWLKDHKAFLDSYFAAMDAPSEDMHIYAGATAVTNTTHQRTCIYHPEETITENCVFEMVPTDGGGKGTHTTVCQFCENAVTEPCDFEIVPTKNGKHTKTCKICGDSFKEPCDLDAAPNGDGTHTGTCKVCGGKVTAECDLAYTPGAGDMHTGICKVCGYTVTEPCDYEVKDNLDGTHTKSCKICNNVVTEPCTCEYVNNNDGTHTGTCAICGSVHTEEHHYDLITVVTPATLANPGLIHESCPCGLSRETDVPVLTPKVVTLNVKTVTAGSIAGLVKQIEAFGGDASTIILGKNVKKIKAQAFRGTPVKTIIVKTKKLTNKNVKASLKSSKVKTIKVKVGSKKINKEYVKKYKKIFTKKNAGKKVKVS